MKPKRTSYNWRNELDEQRCCTVTEEKMLSGHGSMKPLTYQGQCMKQSVVTTLRIYHKDFNYYAVKPSQDGVNNRR